MKSVTSEFSYLTERSLSDNLQEIEIFDTDLAGLTGSRLSELERELESGIVRTEEENIFNRQKEFKKRKNAARTTRNRIGDRVKVVRVREI
jgi:hypothetical protein